MPSNATLGDPETFSPLTPSSVVSTTEETHQVRKYRFIDALRGYAVLLVISHHTGSAFPNLPYPLKKLTNVGWHGVQLFFLISCVTLMMSWRSDERKGIANTRSFWIRRFFRIAPMYYLAAAFYYVAETPATGFDSLQLIASLAFFNAWHPFLIPTVPNRWMVVPGGWSIGVEFTFYFLFPLIAISIRSVKAAFIFFGLAVGIACLSNFLIYHQLVATYGATATSNFIYFWLPNQLPIFALGTVLFFAIDRLRSKSGEAVHALRRFPYFAVAVCLLVFAALAEFPSLFDATFSFSQKGLMPFLLIAALIFMAFSIVLALNENSLLVNPVICALGQVSFSAYLLHFFVLRRLTSWLPFFNTSRTGYAAIASMAELWLCVLPITFGISKLTYQFVELPAIRFGTHLSNLISSTRLSAKAVRQTSETS